MRIHHIGSRIRELSREPCPSKNFVDDHENVLLGNLAGFNRKLASVAAGNVVVFGLLKRGGKGSPRACPCRAHGQPPANYPAYSLSGQHRVCRHVPSI